MFNLWIFTYFCAIVFTQRSSALKNIDLCKPSSLNITVKIDPSKELQYFPINLTCSNWNSSSVDFVISPGPKYADKYFAFASTDQQNVLELRVKSKSTPIDEYPTYLRIEIDGVVLNLLSFDILVTINKIIEIKLLKNPDIEDKLPVGQIVAEFAINSSYQAVNLQVESEDMPDFFTLTTITNNKMFNIEVKSILDLDILRNSGNCCYKHYTEYSRPKECSKLECLSYGVEYNFTVKVTDPKYNLTDTLPVTVFVKDRDDHTLTCETSIKLSRYLRLNVKSISCNDADYGLFRYKTVANTCANEICIDADNGFVRFNVDLIPTKTSCQTVLNVTDGLHSTEVNVTFTFRECPSGSDYKQQVWEIAGPGMTKNGTCPKGYAGNVTRYCTHEGYYEDPIYNCTSIDLMEIFGNLTDDKVELDKSLDKLSDFTSTSGKNNGTLQYRDTATVVNILSVITDKLNVSSNLPEITDKYLQVVDNIIDDKSFSSWNDSIQQTHSGAETVLETLDKFTEKLATGNLTSGIEVPKPNIYLKIAKITKCDNNVEFPDRKSSAKVADWTKHSMDLVKLPCSPQTSSSTFSGVVYRNISQLLNKGISNKSTTQEINAPILSFSLFPSLLDKCKPLDVPIELIFDLYNTSLGSPKCSYWSKPDRKWSTDGCWLVSHNKEDNTVTCKCNHLTNFAILMSPSYTPIGVHHEALSTITLVGCIISMVCLCITVIMFCVFWRHVRSSRTIIHINLCIALFIAYLIFVTGLEATKNKDLCMAVAALLQFFLLVAFFTMLVEGLNLAFIVLKPMSDKKPAVPLLIGAYIIAGTVTGVSIGAHFNDYIREKFCWLSVESGAVWSFIGPVILVIMLNIIIVIIVVYTMFGTASMARRTNKEKTKVALRNIIILTPTLGFAWIIGLFAVNEHAIIFQYLFAILNSLQGLLIFIIHLVLNNKIRDVVKSRYSRWLSSRSLSSEKPTRSTIQ